METARSKSLLRKELLSKRPHSSEGLVANLVRLTLELDAEVIASYQPLPGEPDVAEFNGWVMAMGKTLLLPKVVGDNLEFAPGPLNRGAFGILEPTGQEVNLASCDLILVPALAVDLAGVRLGKGKGFYDRALSHVHSIPKYAVVYDSEVLAALPKQEHDQSMTGAVTPTTIRHFRASSKG